MPNPTKEQLKQKVKDLKEEVETLKIECAGINDHATQLKEELNELKMLTNTPDTKEKKAMRVQLHGGTVKELL